MIAIIDYGMGNLRSVQKALESVGAITKVTSDSKEIGTAEKLVLPGVGAFGQAMNRLSELGLVSAIKQFIRSKKPFLGICLGLQLLFSKSEENPDFKGLGVFSGVVKRFRKHKVPHIGWNQIMISKDKKNNPIFNGIEDNAYAYFCHSYYVEPNDKNIIAAETEYAINFVSAVAVDNIWAVQFHPEKSQNIGLKLLKNFIELT